MARGHEKVSSSGPMADFPGEIAVLNELAKVAYADNRPGDARQYWERSLALQEDQREVHERLGILRTPLHAPDLAGLELMNVTHNGLSSGRRFNSC